ncbi:hypothetical protein EMCG_01557 [[Emmonsia] crescens]|uniref:Amine oxidase n=1 Tax=[Emmonsia] crescens TaxID=73230 RepID=A0A0G2I1U3_9EURO|nr:hypothetical protein EMCG_01557 [Emmonsia crescens UAMH 3008]
MSHSPHPLESLLPDEIGRAANIIKTNYSKVALFRAIYLMEEPKSLLIDYLTAEHRGIQRQQLSRKACVQFDLAGDRKTYEAIVNLDYEEEIYCHSLENSSQFISYPVNRYSEEKFIMNIACQKSIIFQDQLRQFCLPPNVEVEVEPWLYSNPITDSIVGSCHVYSTQLQQHGLRYIGPLPLRVTMDRRKGEISSVQVAPSGGSLDGHQINTGCSNVVDHCAPMIQKPISSPSLDQSQVYEKMSSLVEWRGWRFRIGFNPKEGPTIHDVAFDGYSVLYRLSLSELAVLGSDPRHIWNEKQIYPFKTHGLNISPNSLYPCAHEGSVGYLDAVICSLSGKPFIIENAICIYTERIPRSSLHQKVVQFTLTLEDHTYIIAYCFDVKGRISIEVQITSIPSGVNIDPWKEAPEWGTVIQPGVLAQIQQHLFCLRIDPSVAGHNNTIFREHCFTLPVSAENPRGNGFRVYSQKITPPAEFSFSSSVGYRIRMVNLATINPTAMRPVAYCFQPLSTPKILANPSSIVGRDAGFANEIRVTAADRVLNGHPEVREDNGPVIYYSFSHCSHPTTEQSLEKKIQFQITPENFHDHC